MERGLRFFARKDVQSDAIVTGARVVYGPAQPIVRARMNDLDAILNSPNFSAGWYMKRYPDVALSGISPARHYLLVGGPLGRDASPQFSRRSMPEAYERARASGRSPLLSVPGS